MTTLGMLDVPPSENPGISMQQQQQQQQQPQQRKTSVVGEDAEESRVLIVVTGGTICMQPSEDGLVPVSS